LVNPTSVENAPEPTEALLKARSLLKRGDAKAARELFEGLVKQHPDDVSLMWALVDVHLQQEDSAQAVTWLERVADNQLHRGFLLKAVVARRRIWELAPQDGKAALNLADLLVRDGQHLEAQKLFLRAATLFRAAEQMDASAEALRRGAQLNTSPDDPTGTMLFEECQSFGQAMLRSGRPDAGVEALEAAYLLRPQSRTALRFLVHALIRLGRHARAVATLRPLLETTPTDEELWTLLGRVHLQAGHLMEAGNAFHRLLLLDPLRTPFMMDVAARLRETRQVQAAVAALDACIPGLAHRGQEKDAATFLETLRLQDPRDAQVRARQDALRAWMQVRATTQEQARLKEPYAVLLDAFRMHGKVAVEATSPVVHEAADPSEDPASLEKLRDLYESEGLHEKAAAITVSLSAAHTARGNKDAAREAMAQASRLMAESMRPARRNRGDVDPLTGIAGRAEFEERLGQEFRRGVRDGRPLSLLLLEPDDPAAFRQDSRGEQDARLKRLAHGLFAALNRAPDMVARVEEMRFAVLLPETPAAGALKVAHAMVLAVERLRLHPETPLTASVGVATVVPSRAGDAAPLVAAARAALAQALSQGGRAVRAAEGLAT
jgi:diguanylate cyclase (GGDEF)-like protein